MNAWFAPIQRSIKKLGDVTWANVWVLFIFSLDIVTGAFSLSGLLSDEAGFLGGKIGAPLVGVTLSILTCYVQIRLWEAIHYHKGPKDFETRMAIFAMFCINIIDSWIDASSALMLADTSELDFWPAGFPNPLEVGKLLQWLGEHPIFMAFFLALGILSFVSEHWFLSTFEELQHNPNAKPVDKFIEDVHDKLVAFVKIVGIILYPVFEVAFSIFWVWDIILKNYPEDNWFLWGSKFLLALGGSALITVIINGIKQVYKQRPQDGLKALFLVLLIGATIIGGLIDASASSRLVYNVSAETGYILPPKDYIPDSRKPIRFDDTMHNLNASKDAVDFGKFKKFWQQNDGLNKYGKPISEAVIEKGKVVQYFRKPSGQRDPKYIYQRFELTGRSETADVVVTEMSADNIESRYDDPIFKSASKIEMRPNPFTVRPGFWVLFALIFLMSITSGLVRAYTLLMDNLNITKTHGLLVPGRPGLSGRMPAPAGGGHGFPQPLPSPGSVMHAGPLPKPTVGGNNGAHEPTGWPSPSQLPPTVPNSPQLNSPRQPLPNLNGNGNGALVPSMPQPARQLQPNAPVAAPKPAQSQPTMVTQNMPFTIPVKVDDSDPDRQAKQSSLNEAFKLGLSMMHKILRDTQDRGDAAWEAFKRLAVAENMPQHTFDVPQAKSKMSFLKRNNSPASERSFTSMLIEAFESAGHQYLTRYGAHVFPNGQIRLGSEVGFGMRNNDNIVLPLDLLIQLIKEDEAKKVTVTQQPMAGQPIAPVVTPQPMGLPSQLPQPSSNPRLAQIGEDRTLTVGQLQNLTTNGTKTINAAANFNPFDDFDDEDDDDPAYMDAHILEIAELCEDAEEEGHQRIKELLKGNGNGRPRYTLKMLRMVFKSGDYKRIKDLAYPTSPSLKENERDMILQHYYDAVMEELDEQEEQRRSRDISRPMPSMFEVAPSAFANNLTSTPKSYPYQLPPGFFFAGVKPDGKPLMKSIPHGKKLLGYEDDTAVLE